MIFYREILVFLISVSLLGCASWLPDAYRIDVTQGNAIEREALDRIVLGMSRSEVTAIIGTPLIQDPFHAERWDYIYRFIPGRGEPVQSRVTLFFDGDVLVNVDVSDYREPEGFKDTQDKDEEVMKTQPNPVEEF